MEMERKPMAPSKKQMEDQVLRRMLSTPPEPHKPPKPHKVKLVKQKPESKSAKKKPA